jgi:hypothetical protein
LHLVGDLFDPWKTLPVIREKENFIWGSSVYEKFTGLDCTEKIENKRYILIKTNCIFSSGVVTCLN